MPMSEWDHEKQGYTEDAPSDQPTAHILVKLNRTDPSYQRVLIRDGEYYHPQLFRWFTLPKRWERKATAALRKTDTTNEEE